MAGKGSRNRIRNFDAYRRNLDAILRRQKKNRAALAERQADAEEMKGVKR